MLARALTAVLAALVLVPAAGAAPAAPQNLRGFLLKANEPESATRTFARTPSFAWNPVRGASRYEFQLSSSRRFSENAVIWESETLASPLTTVPVTLPWTTGAPYSYYVRVRALVGGDATPWSERYGFRLRAPEPPNSLSSGANPTPGMIRWTPVEGATAYEVTFLYALGNGESKKIKTATTAADLREYYTFHNDLASSQMLDGTPLSHVKWRVRAVRELEGKPMNDVPAVSYGRSSTTFTTIEPPLPTTPIALRNAVSRSGSSDIVSGIGSVGAAHELVPGFWWTGSRSLNGLRGACPADIEALGVTCPLYHVYVYSDEDCVNRVHSSDLVGSPAYVPRMTGVLNLPSSPTKLAETAGLLLGDAASEGKVFDAHGERVYAAGTDPRLPAEPVATALPGTAPDRRTGLWDTDPDDGRYYWTAVPAVPRVTPENTVEYYDVEFGEDMCEAGQGGVFRKTSEPVIERANGVPFASGMSTGGQIVGAASDRPRFFGRVLVAWKPAPGATKYQVQWSKKASPFRPVGGATTPSTATLVDPAPGVWYYRVRGLDDNRSDGRQRLAERRHGDVQLRRTDRQDDARVLGDHDAGKRVLPPRKRRPQPYLWYRGPAVFSRRRQRHAPDELRRQLRRRARSQRRPRHGRRGRRQQRQSERSRPATRRRQPAPHHR